MGTHLPIAALAALHCIHCDFPRRGGRGKRAHILALLPRDFKVLQLTIIFPAFILIDIEN
jgi:hypothetical protein